jgi:hypothetical protein
MLLKETHNIPVAAAQIENMSAALVLFRNYKDNQSLSMERFIDFLNYPSQERNDFFNLFSEEVIVVNNRYAKRILTSL